ncbi:L-rhamnose mutarotase [Roseivirga pacifica]|uniref:L-rhamnose mutarotase n=1 Tax=Roseivirga pacifica TaxID=1267423 RepID=UPI0020945166|nr:L-rhamnose mutarotase [Roseivirga pacifica]MCO6360456.1 L-rhamnose mutarotase [Roseivirga pacifica]MCO6368345.1 L-rhamnose mutarotase [Roseivirga pacifica]MCO6372487.1 L-rhamnose mutarotase [Roseivirga pacifica]MCO6376545.1 L-rhamnose mutarotase [Roseivirga pacifica]MCO6378175.1 L-rhamnose mutarotase [Roseivirga pacifica]
MKRFALTLDLKNDPQLIEQYREHHRHVWPEIIASIKASGIINMEIYHIGTRLFMIIEASDDFSFEKKAKMDASNPKVQEWEELMDTYQQRLPFAKVGEKWVLMEKIFGL